jgi:hypothetical protein
MIRAYRLVYADPYALPQLWECEQPSIDHLVQNAHTFSRRVVHRYFPTWQALASANARIWDTYYRRSPMYQPWGTWEAWLAEYRALVLEVQAIAEAHQWAGRSGRQYHEAVKHILPRQQ